VISFFVCSSCRSWFLVLTMSNSDWDLVLFSSMRHEICTTLTLFEAFGGCHPGTSPEKATQMAAWRSRPLRRRFHTPTPTSFTNIVLPEPLSHPSVAGTAEPRRVGRLLTYTRAADSERLT